MTKTFSTINWQSQQNQIPGLGDSPSQCWRTGFDRRQPCPRHGMGPARCQSKGSRHVSLKARSCRCSCLSETRRVPWAGKSWTEFSRPALTWLKIRETLSKEWRDAHPPTPVTLTPNICSPKTLKIPQCLDPALQSYAGSQIFIFQGGLNIKTVDPFWCVLQRIFIKLVSQTLLKTNCIFKQYLDLNVSDTKFISTHEQRLLLFPEP